MKRVILSFIAVASVLVATNAQTILSWSDKIVYTKSTQKVSRK